MVDTINDMGYFVNTMNKNTAEKSKEILNYQINRLQDLLNEVQRCCEDKRLYEANKFHIPYAEIRCLMLFQNERYLTVKTIADRLDVAKSRVTKIVNSMFDKELIDRTEDPNDARIKLLRLTSDGNRIVESIKEFKKSLHENVLSHLDTEERNKVITGLELLKSAMKTAKESLSLKSK